MEPIKNSCSLQNDFGNGWGLYIDIEKIKTNFPFNHEILRKKYNNDSFERCNNYLIKNTIHKPTENKNTCLIKIINFIISFVPTFVMICILTYVIIFVL
jgi:hypothetical protein